LKDARTGTCAGCDRENVKLVAHHWVGPDGIVHAKDICMFCNGNLSPRIWGSNIWHFLPDWKYQKAFVLLCRRRADTKTEERHMIAFMTTMCPVLSRKEEKALMKKLEEFKNRRLDN